MRRDLSCLLCYIYYPYRQSHCLLSGTLGAADITTICENSTYTDGATSKVFCEINTTAVASASCLGTPSLLLIQLTSPDGVPTILCQTSYPGTCTNPNVDCGCASNVNNSAKYQAQFTANEITQRGSSISCTIGCEPPLSTNTTVGCQSMTFISVPTTCPILFTTNSLPAEDDKPYCTTPCIIGIVVAILCAIIITAIILGT